MAKNDFSEISNLAKLKKIMEDNGAVRLFLKKLSPNDNSKNQVYLGSDFSTLNIIPNEGVYVDANRKGSKRDRFKADIDFQWVDSAGMSYSAPNAQLILYPKYPEVRMSGFLKACPRAPSEMMRSRLKDRFLFLGITNEARIIGHLVGPNNPLSKQIDKQKNLEQTGVFFKIPLKGDTRDDDLSKLLVTLKAIHLEGWIDSIRLNSSGKLVTCNGTNCGGYTLEAKLGITPNGWSEPDFLGWEVKQHGVKFLDRLHSGGPITLMTPEPTAGIYKERGVDHFIRRFGYPDRLGRSDRINFGGIYRHGSPPPSTGLKLVLNGYDSNSGKINNPDGGISLVSKKGEEAATWLFANMMKHWKRKHAQAAYIPSISQAEPHRKYHYGNFVELGIGTDFLRFLKAVAEGLVYYDPGIKLENASSSRPKIKRRSQFRIKPSHLPGLYKTFNTVDVLTKL